MTLKLEMIDSSQKNVISLSIPDAELVQVRSVANESECKISGIQVFVYNDSHASSPVYYQEGKRLICLFCSVMELHRRL